MQIDFKKVALNEFLEHKTMYYDKIDFTIVESSWQILSSKIKLPFVIHIVGTNGKGSRCVASNPSITGIWQSINTKSNKSGCLHNTSRKVFLALMTFSL